MNTGEIDTFTARLTRFTDKGVSYDEAERIADLLVARDREIDDRRLCLECIHLTSRRRCSNWQEAGVAIRASDSRLPRDLISQLLRCPGFSGGLDERTG